MSVPRGFKEAEIPTVQEIKLGLALFGLTFAFGGIVMLIVLAAI